MSLIDRMKKQTCLHWARTGTDDYGRPIWAVPVEKSCRWVDVNEKYTDANGEERLSTSTVYVAGVSIGDVLMLGTLEDSGLNLSDPLRNDGAWEVRRYDATPNLRTTETLYKAYL